MVVGIALVAAVLVPGCSDDAGSKNRADSDAFLGPTAKEGGSSEAQANKKKGQDFLAENAEKPGVKTLPDGLQYLVLKEGTGKKPGQNDEVEVHYHGTLIDGTVFDSSVEQRSTGELPRRSSDSGLDRSVAIDERGVEVAGLYSVKTGVRQSGSSSQNRPQRNLDLRRRAFAREVA